MCCILHKATTKYYDNLIYHVCVWAGVVELCCLMVWTLKISEAKINAHTLYSWFMVLIFAIKVSKCSSCDTFLLHFFLPLVCSFVRRSLSSIHFDQWCINMCCNGRKSGEYFRNTLLHRWCKLICYIYQCEKVSRPLHFGENL